MPATRHAPESKRQDLGAGFYSLADLRAFVALSGAPEDARRVLPWLTGVLNPVSHTARRPDYSFSDLISLFVVRELLRRGVRPQRIRSAESYLREKWKTDRPFVSDEIKTDGVRVFTDDDPEMGQIESADQKGQQVIREAVKDHLTGVHYHEGTAASWRPAKGVVLDPQVQFGEPVIAGTRVPTEAVAAIAHVRGIGEAAAHLAVPIGAAREAIDFEDHLAKFRN